VAAFPITRGTVIGTAGTESSGLSGSPGLAGGSLGSPQIGYPTRLTVAAWATGSTTVTFQVSYDGVKWVTANVLGTSTAASMVLNGSGMALDITPAPYVQITNGTSTEVWFYAYTS